MNQAVQDMNDADRVVRLANALDVSEFEIFRRAYADWHGDESHTRPLERVFAQYLYFGSVPPWVRHHTRKALAELPVATAAPRRNIGISGALLRLVDSRLGRYLLS